MSPTYIEVWMKYKLSENIKAITGNPMSVFMLNCSRSCNRSHLLKVTIRFSSHWFVLLLNRDKIYCEHQVHPCSCKSFPYLLLLLLTNSDYCSLQSQVREQEPGVTPSAYFSHGRDEDSKAFTYTFLIKSHKR